VRPARIGVAPTPDETLEPVAGGHNVALIAEGNTTVYTRPGIVDRPVIDLEPCQLGIAWRRGDRRTVVRALAKVVNALAVSSETQVVQAS
jgi:hypothetical protein